MIETMKNLKVNSLMVDYAYYKKAEAKAKNASSEEEEQFVRDNFYKSKKAIMKAIDNWNPKGKSIAVAVKQNNTRAQSNNTKSLSSQSLIKLENKEFTDYQKSLKKEICKVESKLKEMFAEDTIKLIISEFKNASPELSSMIDKIDKGKLKELASKESKDRCIEIITDIIYSMITNQNKEVIVDSVAEEVTETAEQIPNINTDIKEDKESIPADEEIAKDDEENTSPLDMIINLSDIENAMKFANPGEDISEKFEEVKTIFEKEIFTAMQLGKICRSQKIVATPINDHTWELATVVEETPGYSRKCASISITLEQGKVYSRYFERGESATDAA